jgi:NAD(P)-dependent dehydrogenase (short-subunit alcohol dehydrogenase family)
MTTKPVAMVTGASRGIGKAIAICLADAGFDVAITARTEREGQGRSEHNSVRAEDPIVALPGSLETTAREIEARGQRALPVRMDLLQFADVVDAPRRVLDQWGRIDVLVNNAILVAGPSMDRVLDLTAESMTSLVVANYVHQVILTQQVIPGMVERGSGRILNMVSGSARIDPKAPAGAGGWGIAYSASKAAFGRFAGGINAEFAPAVVAFNVDPGNVVTEKRKALHPTDIFASTGYGSQSPEDTGAVMAFLATSPEAPDLLGKWIYAPELCAERGLRDI